MWLTAYRKPRSLGCYRGGAAAIILAAFAISLCPTPVQAAITCAATVTSINIDYNPSGTTLSTSGGFMVSCTRALADPSSVAWKLWANTGSNPQGQNRRVQFSGSYYLYDLYTNSISSNSQWLSGPNLREFSGTLNFGAGTIVSTPPGSSYIFQVTAPQTAGPAGVYTDTLTATLTYGATNATHLSAFTVNLNSITSCTLVAPTNLTFNYVSFQGTAATPSANFTVNCTTGLPYTLALDSMGPITDSAVNLTYTLGLSASGGTGTGANQTHMVNGNMAAGQPGTCASAFCTNAAATNKTRTITITY